MALSATNAVLCFYLCAGKSLESSRGNVFIFSFPNDDEIEYDFRWKSGKIFPSNFHFADSNLASIALRKAQCFARLPAHSMQFTVVDA
jgi:hypothetical protein